MHVRNWWSQTSNLMNRSNVQITAYRRQTIPDRGVIGSCDPLTFLGLQSYHWNGWTQSHQILYTQVGYINSSNRMTYYSQKKRGYGHVTVWKFFRLPWCSSSRELVSDIWATCFQFIFTGNDSCAPWTRYVQISSGTKAFKRGWSTEWRARFKWSAVSTAWPTAPSHRSVTRTTTARSTRRASSTHTTLRASPTWPTLSTTAPGVGGAASSLKSSKPSTNATCTV